MRKMCYKTAMSQMFSPRGQNSITKLKKGINFGFELSVVETFSFNFENLDLEEQN